jgi:hypothetical protein
VITGATARGDIYVDGCGFEPTTTPVTATATDDVGVTSAVLTWTDAAGVPGSDPMTFLRGYWRGTLGPVTAVGPVPWTVTFSDAAGNTASTGSKISASCPVIG